MFQSSFLIATVEHRNFFLGSCLFKFKVVMETLIDRCKPPWPPIFHVIFPWNRLVCQIKTKYYFLSSVPHFFPFSAQYLPIWNWKNFSSLLANLEKQILLNEIIFNWTVTPNYFIYGRFDVRTTLSDSIINSVFNRWKWNLCVKQKKRNL